MVKVLVVDDEVEICLLVTHYLRKIGFDVAFSLSIADALEKLSEDIYDLLFIDLNLKDGSGYDLIKALKDSKVSSKMIVISAYDSEHQKALQKGANLFLSKPFTKRTLEESLQKLDFLSK